VNTHLTQALGQGGQVAPRLEALAAVWRGGRQVLRARHRFRERVRYTWVCYTGA